MIQAREPAVELVGRDREAAALMAFVDGSGGVAVVHGAPGIGKSALLHAVRQRAQGRLVLSTAGVQSEAALPFAALERLLRPLLARAGRLPEPQRDALLAGLGIADATVPDHFLIGLATLNLLADAAGVIALVDDAHWLDVASADVLAFVARRIELEPVTLIVAQREQGPSWPAALEISLGPLDEVTARALLKRTAADLPAAGKRRMLEVAAGNPLALVELPRAEAPTLTERLERSFTAQQAELPASTRALLLVAAADDSDESSELLAAAGAADTDLDAAVAARLLERDGTRARFRHPLIRSALYQAAGDRERRDAHAAIARVITGHRRAWHLAAGSSGPDEEIAAALEAAARDAQRRGAVAAAARSLQRASELSPAPEQRVERLLAAAELSVELGDVDIVEGLLARVEGLEPDHVARARIRWVREVFATDQSDVERVRALLADARDVEEDLALKLLLAAATRCWWAVEADDPVREEVVDAARRAADHDPRAIAILAAASAVRAAPRIIERLHAAQTTDPMGMHLLGQAAHMVGDSEVAVRELSRVEVQWRAQGRLALLAQALVSRSWSSVELGNWPAAETAAAEGERLARETGQPLWAEGARGALIAAAGARGENAQATTIATAMQAQLVGVSSPNLSAVLQIARGVAAVADGRHAEAYDQLARLFDPSDPAHHYAEQHGGLSYLAEAAAHCGRVEEARAVFASFSLEGASPLLALGLLVGRAFIADAFEPALNHPLPPFHRARVLLAQGTVLRRQRRAADSRAPLRTARDLFDALGAVPWAERAGQELRASGERVIRRAPEARDRLTPQELQIAQLAADGLTNPEIGERLFLSARTVASHLYRAFPKLGVTSRSELVHALRELSHSAEASAARRA